MELLLAYRLAVAGVPFEFGGDGQADLVCDPPGQQRVWLELTTRDKDDVRALHDDLEDALAGVPVLVRLWLPTRRLAIPVRDREAMCRRVREAVEAQSGGYLMVELPEVGGTASCSVGELLGATGVILDVGSDLTDHFGAVHRELRNVLAVKKDQAERGSFDPTTLLVLDASRLGLSWLRPESVWGPMLARLELDWAEIPFVGFMLCFTSLSTLHVGGVLIKRPDIEARQSQAIDAISQVFGFAPPNA